MLHMPHEICLLQFKTKYSSLIVKICLRGRVRHECKLRNCSHANIAYNNAFNEQHEVTGSKHNQYLQQITVGYIWQMPVMGSHMPLLNWQ